MHKPTNQVNATKTQAGLARNWQTLSLSLQSRICRMANYCCQFCIHMAHHGIERLLAKWISAIFRCGFIFPGTRFWVRVVWEQNKGYVIWCPQMENMQQVGGRSQGPDMLSPGPSDPYHDSLTSISLIKSVLITKNTRNATKETLAPFAAGLLGASGQSRPLVG